MLERGFVVKKLVNDVNVWAWRTFYSDKKFGRKCIYSFWDIIFQSAFGDLGEQPYDAHKTILTEITRNGYSLRPNAAMPICNPDQTQTFFAIYRNIAKVTKNACPPLILTGMVCRTCGVAGEKGRGRRAMVVASQSKWANPPLGLLLPFAQPTRREIWCLTQASSLHSPYVSHNTCLSCAKCLVISKAHQTIISDCGCYFWVQI